MSLNRLEASLQAARRETPPEALSKAIPAVPDRLFLIHPTRIINKEIS
jgi:hypothetical protein